MARTTGVFGINGQPETLTITAREASMAQLRAAMKAFVDLDWASAVTLAGAAEERCPATTEATLRSLLVMIFGDGVNDVRNWMKHDKRPDPLTIRRRDVLMILGRALVRHEVAYGEKGSEMREISDMLKAYEDRA